MLKQNRRALIPVIVVTIAFVLLVAYAYYKMSQTPPKPHGAPPSGGARPKENEGFDFTLFGNIAIALGAVSYWWLLFKKKLASPSKPLKLWGKRLYKLHTYAGWTALVLILVHGGYYLFAKPDDPKLLTGIAAFLVMLALAVYGWLYRRVKNKWMRSSHFLFSHLWLVALIIHAGGFFFFMAAVTILLWAVISFIEKRATTERPA